MTIERIVIKGQMEPFSHYCHVVRADNRIWVSGMVGVDENGFIPADTAPQFDIALTNVDAALHAAGANVQNVVKVTVFLTDVNDRGVINPARQRYFGEHRPASTLIGVSALAMPELKVEIEVEAVI